MVWQPCFFNPGILQFSAIDLCCKVSFIHFSYNDPLPGLKYLHGSSFLEHTPDILCFDIVVKNLAPKKHIRFSSLTQEYQSGGLNFIVYLENSAHKQKTSCFFLSYKDYKLLDTTKKFYTRHIILWCILLVLL